MKAGSPRQTLLLDRFTSFAMTTARPAIAAGPRAVDRAATPNGLTEVFMPTGAMRAETAKARHMRAFAWLPSAGSGLRALRSHFL